MNGDRLESSLGHGNMAKYRVDMRFSGSISESLPASKFIVIKLNNILCYTAEYDLERTLVITIIGV